MLDQNDGKRGKMSTNDAIKGASAYKHAQESVQRPDVGVEAQFPNKKAPKTYRYDSSIAPELSWDENADRSFAEWLLNLVTEAAEKGEAVVFANPQVWTGTQEKFASLSQCAARLRSLTKPLDPGHFGDSQGP
jgi:adenine-specific DNA-methyltransferase